MLEDSSGTTALSAASDTMDYGIHGPTVAIEMDLDAFHLPLEMNRCEPCSGRQKWNVGWFLCGLYQPTNSEIMHSVLARLWSVSHSFFYPLEIPDGLADLSATSDPSAKQEP
jgi:hypothetical protein